MMNNTGQKTRRGSEGAIKTSLTGYDLLNNSRLNSFRAESKYVASTQARKPKTVLRSGGQKICRRDGRLLLLGSEESAEWPMAANECDE
jgi:hypothetical protein